MTYPIRYRANVIKLNKSEIEDGAYWCYEIHDAFQPKGQTIVITGRRSSQEWAFIAAENELRFLYAAHVNYRRSPPQEKTPNW